MRQRRRVEEEEIRHVGEQPPVQHFLVRQRSHGAKPDLPLGRGALRVDALHRTELERPRLLEEAPHALRQPLEERCRRPLERIRQALRRRYRGHRDLMIEARFAHLERGGHVEDLLAVLDGDDAAVREAVAVEAAIHLIDDGGVAIAAPQEIRVQRVHHARFDGGGRGAQGLPEHLSAEYLRSADVAALTAEQIHLELLELEQRQQVPEPLVHGW